MKSAIVAIFDEKDLAALPNCTRFLFNSGVETVCFLHSPSIGITNESLTAPFEKQITDLTTAKKAAADREDYDAAKGFASQIEDAKTERDTAIREGWSKIPEADRMKIYRTVLNPDVLGTEAIFPLKENYPKEEIFRALHELQSVWPADLPPGEFSVVWPLSIAPQTKPRVMEAPQVLTAGKLSKAPTETDNGFSPEQVRRDQLKRHFALVAARKKYDIPDSLPKEQAIENIIAREFPKAA